MKRISVYILVMFILLSVTSCGKKIVDVADSVSPDGKYEAILQQVGSPISYDHTYLNVVVRERENKREIEMIESNVPNDGGAIYEGNWEVDWHATYVNITLKGSEQTTGVLHTVNLI